MNCWVEVKGMMGFLKPKPKKPQLGDLYGGWVALVAWPQVFNEWQSSELLFRGFPGRSLSRTTSSYRFFVLFCFFSVFLGLHLRHMEVSRPGIESEFLLQAYARATAMPDLNIHHSSQQCWIFNPGIEPMSSWMLVRLVSAAPWQELVL